MDEEEKEEKEGRGGTWRKWAPFSIHSISATTYHQHLRYIVDHNFEAYLLTSSCPSCWARPEKSSPRMITKSVVDYVSGVRTRCHAKSRYGRFQLAKAFSLFFNQNINIKSIVEVGPCVPQPRPTPTVPLIGPSLGKTCCSLSRAIFP